MKCSVVPCIVSLLSSYFLWLWFSHFLPCQRPSLDFWCTSLTYLRVELWKPDQKFHVCRVVMWLPGNCLRTSRYQCIGLFSGVYKLVLRKILCCFAWKSVLELDERGDFQHRLSLKSVYFSPTLCIWALTLFFFLQESTCLPVVVPWLVSVRMGTLLVCMCLIQT